MLGAMPSRLAETLDAIAAELRSNVDTRTTIEARTLDAKEFLFLAAVFIAAYCSLNRFAMLAQFWDDGG